MENLRKLFGGPNTPIEKSINYWVSLEEAARGIPLFNCSLKEMDMKVRDTKWKEWAQDFLSLYGVSESTDKERAHKVLFDHKPLDLVEILSAVWELRERIHPEVIINVFDGVAGCFIDQIKMTLKFSEKEREFLLFFGNTSRVPDRMKYGFPTADGWLPDPRRLNELENAKIHYLSSGLTPEEKKIIIRHA